MMTTKRRRRGDNGDGDDGYQQSVAVGDGDDGCQQSGAGLLVM